MKLNRFELCHIIAWAVLASIALTSCSIEKRLAKRVEKAKTIAYQNPKSFAEFCSVSFPFTPNFIKGKDSIIERTVIVKGDSIPCPENKGKIVYVKCPDAKVIYKELVRIDTVVKENLAKQQSLLNEIDLLKGENNDLKVELGSVTKDKDKAESHSAKQIGWIIGLALLLAASGYWNVRKLFF